MTNTFLQRLETIHDSQLHQTLTTLRRGIEKESLRVTPAGSLSQARHPEALGSALTHQWITTDYSEALLEFITPAFEDLQRPLRFLDDVHRFVYQNIGDEKIWVNSMPCRLGDELSIPIAEYGSSNSGRMKHVYRHGLWHRYGRYMQTIAGIHYNLSIPAAFWQAYHRQQNSPLALQDFISEQYFGLIRNFLRNVGLAVYLFGASPAVCTSFLQGRRHKLEPLGKDTLISRFGTSLRMSDLGYHNDAQSGLNISYNSLGEYVRSLQHAIRTPYSEYEKIGVVKNGEYQQLNTNILQIENEFYSSIRPKRVTRRGERPTCALAARGVEYIELRCVDLDPFTPMGINENQILFLDVFALYCLLSDSPPIDDREKACNRDNLQTIVTQGRNPDLKLESNCVKMPFRQWAQQHLDNMLQVAKLFDQAYGDDRHSRVIRQQMDKLRDPSLTPSARVIRELDAHDQSFFRFGMHCALEQEGYFRSRPLSAEEAVPFLHEARRSLEEQHRLEASDTVTFEQYLADYFAPSVDCVIPGSENAAS